MVRARSLALLAAIALLAPACGSDDDGGDTSCSLDDEKAGVLAVARSWYLFPDLLPADVNLASFASARALLDNLTAGARAQGKDRGWSFVSTVAAETAFLAEGKSVGFGISFTLRDQRFFVTLVQPGSAAAEAGFARGDEVLAVGESADTKTSVAELIAADTIGNAFGPAQAGVTRFFDVKSLAGDVTARSMTKREYSFAAVPAHEIIERPGLPPVGYVHLYSFIQPAVASLRAAFAEMKSAGVTEVIVDVRYNGGGAVDIAQLLGSLLAGDRAGQRAFSLRYNTIHASNEEVVQFTAEPQALPSPRVAFITTRGSASASEIVPFALDPYLHVALVGDRTYGKPVGQRLFVLTGCDTIVGLISFALRNSQGQEGYFDGLPGAGFTGPLCPAADDLDHAPGDPLEASTAAAIAWLDGDACPAAKRAEGSGARYPIPSEPSPAQRQQPGLY